MSVALPKDAVIPRMCGIPTIKANHPKFYTKAGWLTPYALACGYLELRGDPVGESNARLERLSSGAYRVSVGGRWVRGEFDCCYATLGRARAAFARINHEACNTQVAKGV